MDGRIRTRRWGALAGTQLGCVPMCCRSHVGVRWVGVGLGSCVARACVSRTWTGRVVLVGCSLAGCRRWVHVASGHPRNAERPPLERTGAPPNTSWLVGGWFASTAGVVGVVSFVRRTSVGHPRTRRGRAAPCSPVPSGSCQAVLSVAMASSTCRHAAPSHSLARSRALNTVARLPLVLTAHLPVRSWRTSSSLVGMRPVRRVCS